jgi:predicted sugar kinase
MKIVFFFKEVEISRNEQQSEIVRTKIISMYPKNSIYKSIKQHVGFGITNDLTLNIGDIVGVIKRGDPTGNNENWFVDNGSKSHIQYRLLFFNNKKMLFL